MFSVFMLSRPRWPAWSLPVVTALALGSVTCQKVPLLAPSGSVITLTAGANALPVNASTQIIAQVIEASGSPPHSGTQVTFTTNLGNLQPANAETDVNGQAIATFNAGTSNGTATITAISGGASASGSNAIKIVIGTAAVGRVSLVANPTILPPTGGTVTITATVFDINGNALPSAPVTLSTNAGTLAQALVSTDKSGVATTTLQTTNTATVTASVGATGGSTTPPSTSPPGSTTPPSTGGGSSSGQTSAQVTITVAAAPGLVIGQPANAPTAGLPAAYTFTVAPASTGGSAIKDLSVNWGDGHVQDLGAITGASVQSHVYASAGVYTISATLTDASGFTVQQTATTTVNAKPQPAVSLTAPTTPPVAGTDTAFTASVAPAANTGTVIQDVKMDFGDGSVQDLGAATGTSISLHHVYQTGGQSFTATLTATDSNGGVGTAVTSVFVQASVPLTVLVSATSTPSGTNTVETFTATVIGLGNATVVQYHWDFGASGIPPKNTSSNTDVETFVHGTGPFIVTVTVTTSDGRTQSGNTTITP